MLPFHIMVGVTGFEPAASTSQMSGKSALNPFGYAIHAFALTPI